MDYYERYVEDLKLKGLAEGTCKGYCRKVVELCAFCGTPDPSSIGEDQVKSYLVLCREKLGHGEGTLKVTRSALKLFYTLTVPRQWDVFSRFRIPRSKALPVVLSLSEVRRVLACLSAPYDVLFLTVYSLGLRISEACRLTVSDIDSDRMQVHVVSGKGSKDRYVPLPETTLGSLRRHWASHRNPTWLFPAPAGNVRAGEAAGKPMAPGTAFKALKRRVRSLGIPKKISPHVLRHSYATHLVEANVPLCSVQEYLGHASLRSTMIYVHVTTRGREESRRRLNHLIRGVVS